MDFIAIDFETANPDLSSICQLGAVSFQGGKAVNTWQTLINPEDYFDPFNMSIHGIDEDMVEDAPTFPKVFDSLRSIIEKQLVVCHTHFDRVALTRVSEKYALSEIDCTWLDSARVARRAWGKFSHAGYGLRNVADELGIEFKHHTAGEDARAAGEILLRAITETGIGLQDWLVRVNKPIDPSTQERIKREGNPDGPLAGEVMVFTGALSIHRHQAADYAAAMGCEVAPSVNNATTILVIGDQDIRKLAGHEKSSKHRKAESLIGKGQPIRIIGESDFLRLANIDPTSVPQKTTPHPATNSIDLTTPIEYSAIDEDIYKCFVSNQTGMCDHIGTWEEFHKVEEQIANKCREKNGKYYRSPSKTAQFAIIFDPGARTLSNVTRLKKMGYKVTTFEKALEYFALTGFWDCKKLSQYEHELKKFDYEITFGKPFPLSKEQN